MTNPEVKVVLLYLRRGLKQAFDGSPLDSDEEIDMDTDGEREDIVEHVNSPEGQDLAAVSRGISVVWMRISTESLCEVLQRRGSFKCYY